MKGNTAAALLGALLSTQLVEAAPPQEKRDVDTRFPYKGPTVPVGDWVDNSVKGNGKGFPRLVEPPAVKPASSNPTNNVNVISVSYVPNGVNIHFQTPFAISGNPTVHWGTSASSLSKTATGVTDTYAREPPCSQVAVTQCSQFFHNVQITGLTAGTTYYYVIPASGGTTASQTLSFTTARAVGDKTPFTIGVLNDMGYTNALGTHKYLAQASSEGLAFAWHGGDISYADDWYSGVLPCQSEWPVCYNGSETKLPGGPPYPAQYLDAPLPAGEVPDQGGPQGGDMSVIYESNWDLWQQWMNVITTKTTYMALPGNHEAACAEFDGGANLMTSYLNEDKANTSSPKSDLTYYSCPPSQRNFTTFQHRFRMPGSESGGVGNFWYSFDYGLAHFVSLNSETDFAYSPEWPFIRDTKGKSELPAENETYSTDSGPFGYINGDWRDNSNYEQINWLKADLAKVDRKKTPWVIAMAHRPMYSSQVSSYQYDVRDAFEDILVSAGVDMYLAGHIHWYERLYPLGHNGTLDMGSVINKNTYKTNPGVSLTNIINGMAGNIESHSELGSDPVLNYTAVLNAKQYGFSKITFHNATQLTWQYIQGSDGSVGDELTLIKKSSSSSTNSSNSTGGAGSTGTIGGSYPTASSYGKYARF